MTTFADVLAARLRSEPGRPLVTFYDHSTGERVELSTTTYANWVAKASSLLVDELDLERGMRIRVDLPPHWLGTVFVGAAWNAGLAVTDADDPDVVVCGPESLARWQAYVERGVVLACSLLPLGVRFQEPLPAGVHDVGVEIWSQPDAFAPWDPATGDDPALETSETTLTQAEMWKAAAAGTLVPDGGRLLTTANPASPSFLAVFTEPLLRSGSMVLVAQTDPAQLETTYVAEHATARFPA